MFRRALAIVALITAIPSVALADFLGSPGYILRLQVVQPSADTYLAYHGRVFVGNNVEYRWGGTSCGTRTLSDASVSLLMP